MDLTDLQSFVAVVDHGTIAAAARAQGVPKSTVSRRVARLEEDLGVALLARSSRAFTVTEDGLRLHARARGALLELRDARAALVEGSDAPRGTLVITASHDLAQAWFFSELLSAYRLRFPRVTVEVRLSERYIDLVAEGVDVALRGHGGRVPGDANLKARALLRPAVGLYASRAYVARRGAPQTPSACGEHDVIAHASTMARPARLETTSGEVFELSWDGAVVRVNDMRLVQSLVADGAGVGLLPVASVERDPARERFVRLLPGWSGRLSTLSLLWPAARFVAPKTRAFLDLAQAWFAEVAETMR